MATPRVNRRPRGVPLSGGPKSWMTANFTAPVLYDDRSQAIPGSRRTTTDCVVGALATCRMLIA